MLAEYNKGRQKVLEDTILKLRQLVTEGIAITNVPSSGISTDATLTAILAAITGNTETASKITATIDGSVSAGAKSVTFATSSDYEGTTLGDTAEASVTYTFSSSLGNTLNSLAYTI